MSKVRRVVALGDGGIALGDAPLFAARGPTRDHFRVLMTADAVGGVWHYALDLARGLTERNIKVGLAVLGPLPSTDQLAAAADIAGLELFLTGLELEWTARRPEEVTSAGSEIAALAQKFGAQIVHLNSPALGAAAKFPAPVVAACHSCVATWWSAVRGGPMPPDFAWRTELVAAGLRRADVVVAPTRSFAQEVAGTYQLRIPPSVIHNGRSRPKEERALVPMAESRSQFAFTAGRLWDAGKNLAALERAAARLDVPVMAAGPVRGPGGSGIQLDKVHALGQLAAGDVARWLARGPVFVSTALYEPFGLAALEAAQAGCALVLSDIPTFRELWDGAARFVPPNDDGAIARALADVFGDHALRSGLAAEARARSLRYSVDGMADQVEALYKRVVRGRSAARPRAVA